MKSILRDIICITLSVSLLIASFPTQVVAQSFLAPPGFLEVLDPDITVQELNHMHQVRETALNVLGFRNVPLQIEGYGYRQGDRRLLLTGVVNIWTGEWLLRYTHSIQNPYYDETLLIDDEGTTVDHYRYSSRFGYLKMIGLDSPSGESFAQLPVYETLTPEEAKKLSIYSHYIRITIKRMRQVYDMAETVLGFFENLEIHPADQHLLKRHRYEYSEDDDDDNRANWLMLTGASQLPNGEWVLRYTQSLDAPYLGEVEIVDKQGQTVIRYRNHARYGFLDMAGLGFTTAAKPYAQLPVYTELTEEDLQRLNLQVGVNAPRAKPPAHHLTVRAFDKSQ